jgi:two-component system OmpR family sensor kinase
MFLRPMRETISLLDNFIKDTTHELNTPVSVIVANIEGIDVAQLQEKEAKKIRRVDIAARTISNIYNDLTYLILHNDIAVKDEEVNLSRLLCERVDYFKVAMEQKKITFIRNVQEDVFIQMDRNKLGRLVDNLISNAIKYNKVNGSIEIKLDKDSLAVIDTGVGIEKDKIDSIFERYHRINETVGGFGIGLHIVAMICKEYNIDIDVTSEINKGTKIKLKFNS